MATIPGVKAEAAELLAFPVFFARGKTGAPGEPDGALFLPRGGPGVARRPMSCLGRGKGLDQRFPEIEEDHIDAARRHQ